MKQIGLQNSRQRLNQRTIKEIKQRLKIYREKRRRQNAHLLLIPQESSIQISPQQARKQKQRIKNRESADNNRKKIKQKIMKIAILQDKIEELEQKIKILESQQTLCFNCKKSTQILHQQEQSAQQGFIVEQQREDNYLLNRVEQDESLDYHFERVFNSDSRSFTGILFVIMITTLCMVPDMLNIQHQNGLLYNGHQVVINNRNSQNHQPIQWLAQRQSMTMMMGENFDYAGMTDTRLFESDFVLKLIEQDRQNAKNVRQPKKINQIEPYHILKSQFPKVFICESLNDFIPQLNIDLKTHLLRQFFEHQNRCTDINGIYRTGINIYNMNFRNETLSFRLELGNIQYL